MAMELSTFSFRGYKARLKTLLNQHVLNCKVGELYRPCLSNFGTTNWLAEQRVIQSINIDNNIPSSELCVVHVSKMLCFFLFRT